jgi:multidrug efflux pump subunit AcrA (membrane-fusion protein)
MGPPVVSVVTVASAPVTLTADLPGRTTPFETSDVRPQVNGIIQARLFKEGSNVRAGQKDGEGRALRDDQPGSRSQSGSGQAQLQK